MKKVLAALLLAISTHAWGYEITLDVDSQTTLATTFTAYEGETGAIRVNFFTDEIAQYVTNSIVLWYGTNGLRSSTIVEIPGTVSGHTATIAYDQNDFPTNSPGGRAWKYGISVGNKVWGDGDLYVKDNPYADGGILSLVSRLFVNWATVTQYYGTASSGPIRVDGVTITNAPNQDGSLTLYAVQSAPVSSMAYQSTTGYMTRAETVGATNALSDRIDNVSAAGDGGVQQTQLEFRVTGATNTLWQQAGLAFEPTGAVARATAAAGVMFQPTGTYVTVEADTLATVVARGASAGESAEITDVYRIAGGGDFTGGYINFEDGRLFYRSTNAVDWLTRALAGMWTMGGSTILTSNSVASTLSSTAAPVSGAAVIEGRTNATAMFFGYLAGQKETAGPPFANYEDPKNSFGLMGFGHQVLMGATNHDLTAGSYHSAFGRGAGRRAHMIDTGSYTFLGWDSGLSGYFYGGLGDYVGTDAGKFGQLYDSHVYGRRGLFGASNAFDHAYGYEAGRAGRTWNSGNTAGRNTYVGARAGAYAYQTNWMFLDHYYSDTTTNMPTSVPSDPTNGAVCVDDAGGRLLLGRTAGTTHIRGTAYYNGAEIGAGGSGDIEGVTAGAYLSGGGTSGTVTLNATGLVNRVAVNSVTSGVDAAGLVDLGTIAGGSGQTVSVGYTGNTLPYASTNGSAVAIYVPTNAATGGGQTVSAGGQLTAATNGSAVAISYTRPTTMASEAWTDAVECMATGRLVFARGGVTTILYDSEILDPSGAHSWGSVVYASTGRVSATASVYVGNVDPACVTQLRLLRNSDVIKLGTRETRGAAAGDGYATVEWAGYNDAATNIWKIGVYLSLGPATNVPGTAVARYSSLSVARMKNAGE